MKKIVLTSFCTLALAGAAFAQGNVGWLTISAGAMTAQTNSGTYSPFFGGGAVQGGGNIGVTTGNASAGTGFYYELLYTGSYNGSTAGVAPTTLTGLGTWTDSSLEASNNPVVSSSGRLVTMNANTAATVAGMNVGTTNYIMLVGWSADLGTTWGGVNGAYAHLQSASYLGGLGSQAFFGISNLGFINPVSTSTSPGAALFGTAATTQGTPINSLNTQLYLIPVPEPGTMALAALGGASMLLFRRRK
jgi:hypothetical protein